MQRLDKPDLKLWSTLLLNNRIQADSSAVPSSRGYVVVFFKWNNKFSLFIESLLFWFRITPAKLQPNRLQPNRPCVSSSGGHARSVRVLLRSRRQQKMTGRQMNVVDKLSLNRELRSASEELKFPGWVPLCTTDELHDLAAAWHWAKGFNTLLQIFIYTGLCISTRSCFFMCLKAKYPRNASRDIGTTIIMIIMHLKGSWISFLKSVWFSKTVSVERQ